MRRLIFGCGYLGLRVARRWRDAGDEVTVVTRSPERSRSLGEEGFRTRVADVTLPDSLQWLREDADAPAPDTLLFAVGFDRTAERSIHEVYADGFASVLDALPEAVQRVLYISTTGVYGPAQGDWIDEQTPTNPKRAGGHASLAAEQVLRESRFAERSCILRLAGIYGPARVPFLDAIRSGEPIAAPQLGWLNLIHVDDAATTVEAAAGIATPSQVYCVSDGSPVARGDFYREIAQTLGAPEPTFAAPPAGSPRAARAASDKRVSNRRMLDEFSIRLAYPSFRDGLGAILGNGPNNR